MSPFYTLKIQAIERLTSKSVKLTFEIPEALKQEFSFKAGQYITLKTNVNGKELRRDYSICSSVGSGDLSISVKAIENGTFSNYANTKMQVGETIEVMPPNGRFTFDPHPDKTRTMAAFAAGSGITPILSIAKTLLEDEPFSNFILVFGNKTPEETMFFEQLQQLKSQYGNRLHIQYVYSAARAENALFGRIEKSTVNLIVKNKYKDVSIESFYLCGPEEMIETVKSVLIENNIKPKQILFELFTASVTAETPITEGVEGETKIKILVDDEETEFTMSQSQTILEAALKHDIDAPYSCQGGVCSSCVARLTEGTAKMRQNNILTESEVAEGLILTCQAQPTSPVVFVDYDDI